MEPKDEDLQVAMAMSRSLLEQEKQEQAKAVTNVKPVAAFPIKWKPGSGMCYSKLASKAVLCRSNVAALHQNFPVGYRRDDSPVSGFFKLSELQQYAISTRS